MKCCPIATKLTKFSRFQSSFASTQNHDRKLLIGFTDRLTMTVKTVGSVISAATGGTVKAVRQADTTLSLDFESGGSMDITTEAPTSCVMVRDKNHTMEYAD